MSYKHPNPKIAKVRDDFNKNFDTPEFLEIFNASEKAKNFLLYDIKKDGTRKGYRRALKTFFYEQQIKDIDKFIINPDTLSNGKKLKYKEDLELRIKEHNTFLIDTLRYEGNTLNVHLSAIQSFIETYKIELGDKLWQNLKKNGLGTATVTDTRTPDRKTLREIIKKGDIEAQAAFLIQMNTGARIDQIPTLTWSNIQEIENEYPLVVYYPDRNKTKIFIKTPITPETKDILLQYKKEREKKIEARKKRTGSPNHQRKNELDETKIFPMTTNNLEKKWRRMCEKAGYYIPSERTGRPAFGTHCLRRFFLDTYGDRKEAELMCGKSKKSEQAYWHPSDTQLREKYAKHADNITILRETADNILMRDSFNKERDDWKKERDELKKKYDDLIALRDVQEDFYTGTKKRLDTLERITKRFVHDDINVRQITPWRKLKDPDTLTPEERKEQEDYVREQHEHARQYWEDEETVEQYEKLAIQERLKHLQENKAPDDKIVTIDGVPYLIMAEKAKKKFMVEHGDELIEEPSPDVVTDLSEEIEMLQKLTPDDREKIAALQTQLNGILKKYSPTKKEEARRKAKKKKLETISKIEKSLQQQDQEASAPPRQHR